MTLPFPIQFASNGPQWAQGFDAWYDYTKPQGSQLLAFPPATDTHSATVYAQSSSGVWQAIPANVPSRTDLGLQTVPTRTNSIRNNSNVGAVAGSPGTPPTNWSATPQTGYAFSIIGTGTEFGLPYIDYRLSGTNASARQNTIFFDTSTGITAANGETWTNSAFVRLVGGTTSGLGNITLGMNENTSVGGFVTFGTRAISPTASMARYSQVRTLSGGATVARVWPWFRIDTLAGGTVDVTYRIYAPQMELGAFASAPILTTSGAATVNGNQQVVDLTGRLSAGVGGVFQFVFRGSIVNITHPIVLNDNSASNSVGFTWLSSGNKLIFSVEVGGLGQGSVDVIASPVDGATYTVAFAAQQGYAMAAAIAQTAPTPVSPASWPPSMRQVVFGGLGSNASRNVYQVAKRGALRFGAQNASTFADLFAKATILSAVS